MPLVMPVGFGLAIFRFLLVSDPEEMVITMGFDGSVGVVPSGNVVAEDLADAWVAGTPASDLSNEYTFVGVTLRWNEGGGAQSVYEHLRNLQGTFVASQLPQNCAVLVRKLTTQAGRRGKGRMYVPPFSMSEGNVDGRGAIATSTRTNLQTAMDTFLTQFNATAVNAVLLHTDDNPGPTTPTPITSLAVADRIATRRLRMRP